MRPLILRALLATAGLAVATTSARALPPPLPDATGVINISQGSAYRYGPVAVPAALTLTGSLGVSQATIAISGPDGPEVLAGAGGVGLSAVFLTYSYEVVGPVTGALIPTTITGYLDVEGDTSGVSAGFAVAAIYSSADTSYAEACIGDFEECASETSPSSTPYSHTFMVPANTPETLALDAAVEAEGSDGGGYSAYVDPVIAIDRSAPGTAPYGLIESPGVNDGPVALGPVAGVPEPASWLLLMTGFAALGWTVRSRRGLTPGAPAASV